VTDSATGAPWSYYNRFELARQRHSNVLILIIFSCFVFSFSPASFLNRKISVAANPANTILCEGPLSKLGSGLFGGWNERWFRLTGLGLFYYQNPKAPPKFGEHATTIDISQGKYFRTHKGVENAIECVDVTL
jgi:hypothetical protein